MAKRSGIVYFVVGLLQIFTPAAFAQHLAMAATTAGARHQAADAIPLRGSLYRVAHQGNIAYLFGTLHVGQTSFYPLEPRVTAALANASKLAVEIDIRNSEPFQRAMQVHGLYADGQTLHDHLTPDSVMQLDRTLARFDIPLENVLKMKPWLIANMLLGLELENHGYQRSHGLEYFLLSRAGEQSKAVLELESAEYQLSLFDGMTAPQQETYLRENLAELENGSALQKARDLIAAWSTADVRVLDAFLQQSINEKTVSSDFIHRVLLDGRNPPMANRIEALLLTEPSLFVGVGLLHLMGENGVPALLRQRGYAVEKLY